MKKTISINIGGIIFHIEEDGYEKLKGYLSSIQKYFSSFADSKEILSDIEGRIAERFLNKQKVEAKQVISLADVDELIAAMGTVADFEAIEQAEDILADPLESASAAGFTPKEETGFDQPAYIPENQSVANEKTFVPRKLVRDLKRKLLGGVASGLAHYFTIDPLWVRIAFLAAVFSLPAGAGMWGAEDLFGPVAGFSILVYIAMWIAFPGSSTLEEDTKIKKFYRNPDRKVVGGVAAGVASYFGVDLGVVRFLWVLSIMLFGTGFIVYIVLWIIAPSANTLTEKMEMQGEPITLSNIETNIKQSLNLDEKTGEEHVVTKILLFPFRAIALVIGALGKLLKSLGPVVRILIGVILIGFSVVALFGLIVGGSVGFGLSNFVPWGDIPPMLIIREVPSTMIFSAVLLCAIPFVIVLILGLTLIANRRVVSASVWLTLAGLWIVGIIGSAITGGIYQKNFTKRGEFKVTDTYVIPAGTLLLDEEDNDDLDEYHWESHLSLEGYAGDSIRLEKEFSARGKDRDDAKRNAQDITYRVVQKDSILIFDENPVFVEKGKFRDQRLRMTLQIPYERQFAMTSSFYHEKINHWDYNHKYNLNDDDVNWDKLRWVMRRDSGLICVNIPAKYIAHDDREEDNDDGDYDFDDDNSAVDIGERGNFIKQFTVSDFKKVSIGGAYSIVIRQGAELNVAADGNEDDVDDLKISVEDGVLKVKRTGDFNLLDFKDHERIGLVITMPTIEGLDLSGVNKTRVVGFANLQKLDVDISGASKTEIDVQADQLTLGLSGASKATLKGSAKSARIDLTGACKLDAVQMNIQSAEVDATGASKADFGRIVNIRKSTSGVSKINVQP
jgi:phage shock protein PspC (stress-responsive transcriptional regulator)